MQKQSCYNVKGTVTFEVSGLRVFPESKHYIELPVKERVVSRGHVEAMLTAIALRKGQFNNENTDYYVVGVASSDLTIIMGDNVGELPYPFEHRGEV